MHQFTIKINLCFNSAFLFRTLSFLDILLLPFRVGHFWTQVSKFSMSCQNYEPFIKLILLKCR